MCLFLERNSSQVCLSSECIVALCLTEGLFLKSMSKVKLEYSWKIPGRESPRLQTCLSGSATQPVFPPCWNSMLFVILGTDEMDHLCTRHSRTETKRAADIHLLSRAHPEVYSIGWNGVQSPHVFVNHFFFFFLFAEDNSWIPVNRMDIGCISIVFILVL